jgi:8-amino-7-oxononanoate synthase
MFGSNSYLGASNMDRAKEVNADVVRTYGIGSGGVPLLSGTTSFQNALERKLSDVTGFGDTMLFSSGYTANLGVVTGLLRSNNLIIHDKLNHASLLDATALSGAKMVRFNHNDMASLEKVLRENAEEYKDKMIVATDGIFSMDGDIANIPEILRLAKQYGAILLIDDAHSIGVIGKNGAGTLSHYGITDRENIIVTGTLSKALGTLGGYVSASKEIIDYLRIYARSNMFSTSLPQGVCAAAKTVLDEIETTDVVERLNANATYLADRLRKEGFNVMNTRTPIIPLLVGDPGILTAMVQDAFDAGYVISGIYAPAVPPKLTRFRISVMASHTKEDMDSLVQLIIKLFEKYGLPHFIS